MCEKKQAVWEDMQGVRTASAKFIEYLGLLDPERSMRATIAVEALTGKLLKVLQGRLREAGKEEREAEKAAKAAEAEGEAKGEAKGKGKGK